MAGRDCWMPFSASVSAERRVEIMKDSRLGTFGALGLILLLAVKTTAAAGSGLSLTALFLRAVIGRGTMVLAAHGSRHRGDGMAAAFLNGLDDRTVKWAAILGLGPALLAACPGYWLRSARTLVRPGSGALRNLGCPSINGDVLGGMVGVFGSPFPRHRVRYVVIHEVRHHLIHLSGRRNHKCPGNSPAGLTTSSWSYSRPITRTTSESRRN